MGSPKMLAQCQSQGHVTSAFMWYVLKKKKNKNIIYQHGLLDLVYSCVYIHIYIYIYIYIYVNVYIVTYIYKKIHIEKIFKKVLNSFTETYFLTNENPFRYAGTHMP